MARKARKTTVRERRLRAEGKGIQAAGESMERRGTKGSFGPATESNIKRGLAAGGKQAKKAQFALNMKRLAARRGRGGRR
jgi:hypothetical protein